MQRETRGALQSPGSTPERTPELRVVFPLLPEIAKRQNRYLGHLQSISIAHSLVFF